MRIFSILASSMIFGTMWAHKIGKKNKRLRKKIEEKLLNQKIYIRSQEEVTTVVVIEKKSLKSNLSIKLFDSTQREDLIFSLYLHQLQPYLK